jgi:hypothetical protein
MSGKDVEPNDDWQVWWDARIDAMRPILGEPEPGVLHAPIPFYLGGTADVIMFRHHVDGIVYVTNDLIGDDQQVQNEDGWFELMLCLRNEDDWPQAPGILSNFARYTTEARLGRYDTMDFGPAFPEGATLSAMYFVPYANLTVRGLRASLLLCLGITDAELRAAQDGQVDDLVGLLKKEGVFPFTDPFRKSVV